ncbi:(2Fe-2S)-binding protein [Brachyspira pilosicoli]|uniref:(2Fe-2S)-binding protein n=1 Tax=Brachyspira pilosicoli TaxID=52584 RepID=A0A5C8EQ85_BRAPL|nr:(2Fe-2S)-binding protein [Brachyspira pilosicoli]TXJ40137.1 (2Fe-2S)-binding protein [Brachyspira pilosicoli]
MDLNIEDLKCQTSINYDKILCNCKNVSYRQVYSAIAADKLTTVESVSEKTQACTGCGGCKEKIEHLLEYVKKNEYAPLNF